MVVAAATLLLGVPASAQQDAGGPSAADTQASGSDSTLVLVRGTSEVLEHGATLERVSIADPEIADAVVVSADEVVVNARVPGQTTLFLWDDGGGREKYGVRVTADAGSIQEQLDRIFPDTDLRASASGNTLILTGTVRDPGTEERALAVANSLAGEEASVLNQMRVPDRGQVMLKVRFAEVNRSALEEFGLEAYAVEEGNVAGGLGAGQIFTPSDAEDELVQTSQDAVNFFLFHRPSRVQAFFRGLQTRGLLKSLAEPNLMAVPGDTASFLAGGEFPFPVLQGGGTGGGAAAVTIQFKEFGIRLNFVPTITNSGAVRIRAAPEVSQLDFSQGLEVSGFNVPALLSRRAETVIELSPGQTFAIAGLVDNTLNQTVNKVPFLGDIPILGELFRSEEMRQERSELLVLVTPHIVRPTDEPPPDLPTGEPDTWDWVDELQHPERQGEELLDAPEEGTLEGRDAGIEEDGSRRRSGRGSPRRSMMPERSDPASGGER